MNLDELFWESIANRLQTKVGMGPENWKSADIKRFLTEFLNALDAICKSNPDKAKRCGIQNLNDELLYDQLVLAPDTIRNIFRYKRSSGSPITKNMFAIYFGFDSFDDYILKNQIVPILGDNSNQKEQDGNKNKQTHPDSWPYMKHAIITISLIVLIGLLTFWNLENRTKLEEAQFLFESNREGIGVINTLNKEFYQILSGQQNIAGIDVDTINGFLFWANLTGQYIGRAEFDNDFPNLVGSSIMFDYHKDVNFPCGIAVDPENRVIYCSNHIDTTIAVYSYKKGITLQRSLIPNLAGRPSSIELDTENQILYWTDVDNNQIGRYFIDTQRAEPDFIKNAGKRPDGLSLDLKNSKLYWANSRSKDIGWTTLPDNFVKYITLKDTPISAEVDGVNGFIYYSSLDRIALYKGLITKDGADFDLVGNNYIENRKIQSHVIKLVNVHFPKRNSSMVR